MSAISEETKEQILSLWRKPGFPGAFTGLATFRTALALNKDIHLSKSQLFNIMKNDEDFVLETKRRRKQFPRRKLVIHGFGSVWQSDIAEMPLINDYIGFLCCIDLFSRNIYCKSLKSKEAKAVKVAFQEIFKQAGIKPQQLETDRGSEFLGNRSFFLKQQFFFKIKVGKNKASFAEHAIQVKQKSRIHKWARVVASRGG